MRIGGGTANRRKLQAVTGQEVRPTSGFVRQALFNILRDHLQDAIFVDLFAGTGSVGLEALSHGARQVFFIEHDRRALSVLQANVRHCATAEQATILTASLPRALYQLPTTLQADMLFLDPPYASDLAEETLKTLAQCQVLAPHGILIWQHDVRHVVPAAVLNLPRWKSRRYGNTQLSFYTSARTDTRIAEDSTS